MPAAISDRCRHDPAKRGSGGYTLKNLA